MVSIHHYGHGSLKADLVMLLKKGLNQEEIVGLGKNWNGKTRSRLDMIQLCFLGDCRIVEFPISTIAWSVLILIVGRNTKDMHI